jgi:hypothetical protein
MLELKHLGKKSDTGWKEGAWNEARNAVNHRYQLELGLDQVKNKMTNVRLEYFWEGARADMECD